MDIGFETIGNATLVCHDRVPILVTDPWIEGDAYFGSWTFSHAIPPRQREAIEQCRFVWVSHGHPDHLSSRSLGRLPGKKMLLPDHYGGRIHQSFRAQGYDVQVLKSGRWERLSDRIKVLCISDYNQDGILLIDVNGRLVVNLNDASDNGWGGFVRKTVKQYDASFLLRLSGYGDADMINLFDEQGRRIPPRAAKKLPPGVEISGLMRHFGTKYFIPFSSMHKYQRKDSVWANEYTTELSEHAVGFDPGCGELLPAFIRYDCAKDRFEKIEPPENSLLPRDPGEFGDDWNDPLDQADAERISRYFKAISHLDKHFDFINMRVAGKDNVIELAGKKFNRGITFEAPRHSLMIAVQEEIFDDMLIGNFMKTTLHGSFPQTGLYPDFTPYVAKYADNGRAKSREELERYFDAYRKRAPIDYLRHRLEKKSIETMRTIFPMDSALYRLAKGAYHLIKRF
jgi:L-ascorbate metabolism protein UlaG (beta-lactamase superfamily)